LAPFRRRDGNGDHGRHEKAQKVALNFVGIAAQSMGNTSEKGSKQRKSDGRFSLRASHLARFIRPVGSMLR